MGSTIEELPIGEDQKFGRYLTPLNPLTSLPPLARCPRYPAAPAGPAESAEPAEIRLLAGRDLSRRAARTGEGERVEAWFKW
jgi:hypothetical protein